MSPASRYGEEIAALENFEENLAGEKTSDLATDLGRRASRSR